MKKIVFIIFAVFIFITSCKQSHTYIHIEDLQKIDSTLSFRDVYAVDKKTVYVSGTKGSLYFTVDGGQSWRKIPVPGSAKLDFRDIAVLSPDEIILMSAGRGIDSKILRSGDNGKNWKIVYQNIYPDGFLDSIEFWDELNGIAVGDPVNGRFDILLTGDGGNSWTEVDSTKVPAATEGEAFFAASGTCIAVAGKDTAWIATGGTRAEILKTTNRGRSWQAYKTPVTRGFSGSGIFSVHFVNSSFGIIAGGDYLNPQKTDSTAAISVDGGMTWQLTGKGLLPYQSSVKSMKFSKGMVFMSTGPEGTYYSTDGILWKQGSNKGFHCLAFSENDNSIWAAGPEGMVGKIVFMF